MIKLSMIFDYVSKEAFEKIIEDAPGKPFYNQQEVNIGKVISAYKAPGELQIAVYHVELNEDGKERYVEPPY